MTAPSAPTAPPARSGRPAPGPAASVTAVFVRLKLALLRNGLRQSSGRRAAFAVAAVVSLLLAASQLLALIALRGHEHAAAVAVVLTMVLAGGWAVVPLLVPGGDETLDPTRLVMLPLRPRSLVVPLLAASLAGIGPVFALTLAAGCAIAIAHGAAGVPAAVIAVPLTVLVCVALARAVAAGNIRLLTSRRGRDLALLSGLFIAIGFQFVNLGVEKLTAPGGLSLLDPAADVLRWVPPASAMAAVQAAGDGSYGEAAALLGLTVAALVLLLWWWERSLTRLMTSPDGSTLQAVSAPSRKERAGSGPGSPFPAGRSSTVMVRSLRYALRDPKTKAAWATCLGIGLLLPVVSSVQGNRTLWTACWAAGLLGMQMFNQFGQDSSAFWMVVQTVSSPRDAYLELRGRLLALAAVGVPYVTLVTFGAAAFLHRWPDLPEVLGVALALFGALLGTGAVASALFPYSIPQDSGYKNVAPGQAGLAWMSILGGVFAGALLCAPVVGPVVWLHVTGGHAWLWLALPVGVLYGTALALLGLRLAAPRTADRLPEILTAVSKG